MSCLERRYRCLLLAYPGDHRRAHGEEMVGVWVDSAAQRGGFREGVADAIDVLAGGIRIRLRRAGSAGWSDGLAIASVAMPAALCVTALSGLLVLLVGDHGNRDGFASVVLATAPLLVWPWVLALALGGLRRVSALLCWSAVLMPLVAAPVFLIQLDGPWLILGIVAAVTVTGSPGPQRGAALLGPVRCGALFVGAGFVGAAHFVAVTDGRADLSAIPGPFSTAQLAWAVLAVGAVLIAGSVFTTYTPASRCATVVLALPIGILAFVVLRSMSSLDHRLVALYDHGALAGVFAAGTALGCAAVVTRTAARRQRLGHNRPKWGHPATSPNGGRRSTGESQLVRQESFPD